MKDEPELNNFGSVEKDIYVEPPDLTDDISDEEKVAIWKEWQKEDDKKRRAHRLAFNKKLKKSAPDVSGVTLYKSGGVYKQKNAASAVEGDSENLENILAIPATQDRHFQPRGHRSGKKNSSRKYNREKRAMEKAQLILSRRNK